MAQWRDASAAAGFLDPQTYLATGNMLTETTMSSEAARAVQTELLARLGLPEMVVPVLRAPETLARLVAADPFPNASRDRPSETGVYFFADDAPDLQWIGDYDGPERLAVVDRHLIVDYGGQISASPKLPRLIEKRSGTVTARNWSTLRGLAERGAARQQRQS